MPATAEIWLPWLFVGSGALLWLIVALRNGWLWWRSRQGHTTAALIPLAGPLLALVTAGWLVRGLPEEQRWIALPVLAAGLLLDAGGLPRWLARLRKKPPERPSVAGDG